MFAQKASTFSAPSCAALRSAHTNKKRTTQKIVSTPKASLKTPETSSREATIAVVLSLTILAQPAASLAASDSKATAKALLADYEQKRAIVERGAPKTKNFSKGPNLSLPSFSAPSFSFPGGGGSKKAAPAKKAAKKAPPKEAGTNLLGTFFVLFSPLLFVQAEVFGTLARLAKQKAELEMKGK